MLSAVLVHVFSMTNGHPLGTLLQLAFSLWTFCFESMMLHTEVTLAFPSSLLRMYKKLITELFL